MPEILPQKYYLAHAKELFGFIENHCPNLLDEVHANYLKNFHALDEEAQCLLIRLLTRKHPYVKRNSLTYSEIRYTELAEAQLHKHGFISFPIASDWEFLAPIMTKPELMSVLQGAGHYLKGSNKKSTVLEHIHSNIDGNVALKSDSVNDYIVRREQVVIDYLFFLFFGDLRNRFQKFAMRDLGVLHVRKSEKKPDARFNDKNHAQTSFRLQCLLRDFNDNPEKTFIKAVEFASAIAIQPTETYDSCDKLLLKLGDHIVERSPQQALALWQLSSHPSAIERWVRQGYRIVGKKDFETEILKLRERSNLPSLSRLFIEDFYARKYMGKRTSIYTDMLRKSNRTLDIDETFINNVEDGVIHHYQQLEIFSVFTENTLWRTLFAFTFWSILFNQKQHNEFDRLPAPLRSKKFYSNHQRKIENCLNNLQNKTQTLIHFTKLATQHYGYPTGLFRWSTDLLEPITQCLKYAPDFAIEKTLRCMAKNFEHAKDGYPDLLVIDDQGLRFEEIKAPGDVLRPNQLVSIQRLKESGFCVEITQVAWSTNPNQIYSVVDIETTGGRQSGNAITEIAVVKVKGGAIIDEWSTLINPQKQIPRHITHLTGIDNKMVRDAPVFSEIASQLKEQLNNSIFVAHNVGFDYGFIKAAYNALGQTFRMPKYCTVKNARRAFPGHQSYSLGKLTRALDINLDNHHRALDDARATAHLLRLIQHTSE